MNGIKSGYHLLNGLTDKLRRSADSKSVSNRHIMQTDVTYTNVIMLPTHHTEQHAWRIHRFCKNRMNIISEHFFQAESDAARRTADTAWKIYVQRVVRIDFNPCFRKLILQSQRADSLTQNQRYKSCT